MDKKHLLFYKTIVVGVIVLFIGVGIQPAIAKVNPDIIDIKLDTINKDELIVKINEIKQKYGNTLFIKHFINILSDATFIFTWMYLFLYVIFVAMGLSLYVLLKFYQYYYYYYY
jgi:hypothetical protein